MRRLIYLVSVLLLATILMVAVPMPCRGELTLVAVQFKAHENDGDVIPNATLYLDGNYLGKTDGSGNLLIITYAGEHEVEVVKDGYDRKTVTVQAYEDTACSVELKETEYQIPWDIYALVGVAGLALVGLIIYIGISIHRSRNILNK